MKKEDKTQKTQDLELKNKELTEQLQRLQAEFINFRQRAEQEKLSFIEYGKEQALKELIDLFENLEKAKENPDKEGINLIYKELQEILQNNKVQPIDNKGKYNPEYHEVILKENSKEEEDTIIEIFQKGYTINGRILRASKVKVSGGKK